MKITTSIRFFWAVLLLFSQTAIVAQTDVAWPRNLADENKASVLYPYATRPAIPAATDLQDGVLHCASKGEFPWHDWIARVKMDGVDQSSGKSPYSDFTGQTINVNAGTPVGLTLETGFSYFTFDEYWKVWIDYNQNGIFEEATETFVSLVAPRPADGTPLQSVNTTAFIQGGFMQDFTTRMRVAMKRGSSPTPCETFAFGEVEDYSIHIAPGGGQSRPDLSLINFLTASSGAQGAVVPFTFDLKNSGTANATGNYTIGAYLSTDGQLGANDVLVGTIQTGNTPIGTIQNVQGALAVPGNFAPGNYFLFLKADVDNTIAELDELNNLSSRPFTVTSGTGGGADLELTLQADQTTVAIYSNVTFTLLAKNAGTQTIQSAKIAIGVCELATAHGFNQASRLVYAGTPPPPSFGTYEQVSQSWEFTNLAPGQTAQLSIPLFTLTAAERKIIAFCYMQSPGDPDSQPGGGPANCTPTQDDEAVWTINAGQNLLPPGELRGDLTTFQKLSNLLVYPNPASELVFVNLEGWQGKTAIISLYNQLGVQVLERRFDLISASPEMLDLSGINGGTYFLKMETPGERAVFEKLYILSKK